MMTGPARPKGAIAYVVENGDGAYDVAVFRCQDETRALNLARSTGWVDGNLEATRRWLRWNPCHCNGGHHHDIGFADGPGRGNSPGYYVVEVA